VRDTPAMGEAAAGALQAKGHQVVIYPDASGQNTSSKNASESDLSILRGAASRAGERHEPAVRDRVNAVNAMILNDAGKRRWKVNTDLCPTLTEALEQQAYDAKNGEPDKKSGHDHPNDAQGYFLVQRYPITPRMTSARTTGH
jgi:hypothetical protein